MGKSIKKPKNRNALKREKQERLRSIKAKNIKFSANTAIMTSVDELDEPGYESLEYLSERQIPSSHPPGCNIVPFDQYLADTGYNVEADEYLLPLFIPTTYTDITNSLFGEPWLEAIQRALDVVYKDTFSSLHGITRISPGQSNPRKLAWKFRLTYFQNRNIYNFHARILVEVENSTPTNLTESGLRMFLWTSQALNCQLFKFSVKQLPHSATKSKNKFLVRDKEGLVLQTLEPEWHANSQHVLANHDLLTTSSTGPEYNKLKHGLAKLDFNEIGRLGCSILAKFENDSCGGDNCGNKALLAMHSDEILVATSNPSNIKQLIPTDWLELVFLGKATEFMNINFTDHPAGIYINQERLVNNAKPQIVEFIRNQKYAIDVVKTPLPDYVAEDWVTCRDELWDSPKDPLLYSPRILKTVALGTRLDLVLPLAMIKSAFPQHRSSDIRLLVSTLDYLHTTPSNGTLILHKMAPELTIKVFFEIYELIPNSGKFFIWQVCCLQGTVLSWSYACPSSPTVSILEQTYLLLEQTKSELNNVFVKNFLLKCLGQECSLKFYTKDLSIYTALQHTFNIKIGSLHEYNNMLYAYAESLKETERLHSQLF